MDTLNASTISENLTARTKYGIAGAFFRLIDAAGACKVELFRAGRVVGVLDGFLPGLAVKNSDFDGIAITPSVAGTVAFVIASDDVSYDRAAGSVTISGTPNVAVTNQPAKQGAYTRANVTGQDNVTATTLFPANPNRRVVIVRVDSGQNVRLRVDGNDATPAAGLLIPTGGYWESPPGFAPTGKVSVISVAAGGSAIEAMEG